MEKFESLKGNELKLFLQKAYQEAVNLENIANEIKSYGNGPGEGFIFFGILGILCFTATFVFKQYLIDVGGFTEDNFLSARIGTGVWGIIGIIAIIVKIIMAPMKAINYNNALKRQSKLWADSNNLRNLPQAYQSSDCISAIYNFIENKRASTFKECTNLLAEAQWRARMEANAARTARYAEEAAEAAEKAERKLREIERSGRK